ncbi:MAG TPA: MerR family transcriptional regulator [Terriglobia bacterium]|nr:MerR family transcriptional regulator [Terriglobia bacterium]
MRTLSTVQVARAVGVHKVTLQRWLLDGKVPEPRRVRQGGVEVRIWTDRDVDRVHKYKAANYRKGRGRKKTQKKSGNR